MNQDRSAAIDNRSASKGLRAITTGVMSGFLVLSVSYGAVAAQPLKAEMPTHKVSAAEQAHAKATPIKKIMSEAKAMKVDAPAGKSHEKAVPQGPDGPELKIDGAPPAFADVAEALAGADAAAALPQNGAWPGSYSSNPNAQIGKLWFDTKRGPGESWNHCSATAINSENKSLVLTAGHCVFNPDPDKNGLVDSTNKYWYENVQFCPGYEFGCNLGVWYARQLYTTQTWFYGSPTTRYYDWTDDIGIVLMSPNPTKGLLVNAVGGQGIQFNIATGLQRTSFGYPITDSRFPGYTYSGEDMMYCPGRDAYDGAGHIVINCTMTGGASGGPWIIKPTTDWLGTVNSVNSHKPSGTTMGGPYFGQAESDLFQYARAR